jgi:tetratricopeptide (TPR) repeat protein
VLGQLSPAEVVKRETRLPKASDLEALEAWHFKPTLWNALDLIGAAFVVDDLTHPDVLSAAQYLDLRGKDCPAPARVLVSRILHPEAGFPETYEVLPTNQEHIRLEIHAKRRRLGAEPRNSILWTDLARLYTSLGQLEKAERAIEMSCSLAPDNRFVIRSAARFLAHVGDYERALRLLRTTLLKESDPWVVAAEVGISSLSEKEPRLLKLGRRMVDSRDFSEFAKSELASAVATVELNEGNKRAAKKLFRQSLALPTENSVAQAEWASTQVGEVILPSGESHVLRNYEAKSIHGYRIGNWDAALVNAEKWFNDQPFSSRPAMVVSHLLTGVFESYEEALNIVKFSLNSNPGDRGLTNNRAFALINLDRLDEAELLLKGIDARAADDSSTITLLATMGLLFFRKGLSQVGRNLYLDAVELAKNKLNRPYAAMAALYLAIEEIRADTETKLQTFQSALQLASETDDPFVRHLHTRLTTMASAAKISPPGSRE